MALEPIKLPQEPLENHPKEPPPESAKIFHEEKRVLEEVTPGTKSNEKTNFPKDKLKSQLPRDNDVEEQQNIDVSGLKNRLVGMDGAEIIRLMGLPDFRRLEPPARIWQYRTKLCIVNIFLYEIDQMVAAEYVESLGPNNTSIDEDECFRGILKIKGV